MAKKRKAKGPDDSDRIRVPFGESSKSYPGGFNPSDSDAKGAPKKRRSRDLPSLPPDADPSDDAAASEESLSAH